MARLPPSSKKILLLKLLIIPKFLMVTFVKPKTSTPLSEPLPVMVYPAPSRTMLLASIVKQVPADVRFLVKVCVPEVDRVPQATVSESCTTVELVLVRLIVVEFESYAPNDALILCGV